MESDCRISILKLSLSIDLSHCILLLQHFFFLLAELQNIPQFLFNCGNEIPFKSSETFSTLPKLPRPLQVDSSYNLSNVAGKYSAHLVIFLYQLY